MGPDQAQQVAADLNHGGQQSFAGVVNGKAQPDCRTNNIKKK